MAGCRPYVRATYDDGIPQTGGCCASEKEIQSLGTPDGGIINHCLSIGNTAYCMDYSEDGKCTRANSLLGTCTPYVVEYWENGNPKRGGCH